MSTFGCKQQVHRRRRHARRSDASDFGVPAARPGGEKGGGWIEQRSCRDPLALRRAHRLEFLERFGQSGQSVEDLASRAAPKEHTHPSAAIVGTFRLLIGARKGVLFIETWTRSLMPGVLQTLCGYCPLGAFSHCGRRRLLLPVLELFPAVVSALSGDWLQRFTKKCQAEASALRAGARTAERIARVMRYPFRVQATAAGFKTTPR